MEIAYQWRGSFSNEEVNRLHAEASEHRVYDASDWNWEQLVRDHSLGWVVAREGEELLGFVNVLWDGLVHAWIQDTMVAELARRSGIGTRLIEDARDHATAAGCEWLHVDFDEHLKKFYIDACGFKPASAGLIDLA